MCHGCHVAVDRQVSFIQIGAFCQARVRVAHGSLPDALRQVLSRHESGVGLANRMKVHHPPACHPFRYPCGPEIALHHLFEIFTCCLASSLDRDSVGPLLVIWNILSRGRRRGTEQDRLNVRRQLRCVNFSKPEPLVKLVHHAGFWMDASRRHRLPPLAADAPIPSQLALGVRNGPLGAIVEVLAAALPFVVRPSCEDRGNSLQTMTAKARNSPQLRENRLEPFGFRMFRDQAQCVLQSAESLCSKFLSRKVSGQFHLSIF